jgi:hypothetical protein
MSEIVDTKSLEITFEMLLRGVAMAVSDDYAEILRQDMIGHTKREIIRQRADAYAAGYARAVQDMEVDGE